MGSTLAFRTGFAHGRRKNALAEEINRSPIAKRERVIIYNEKQRKVGRKGVEERAAVNGDTLA